MPTNVRMSIFLPLCLRGDGGGTGPAPVAVEVLLHAAGGIAPVRPVAVQRMSSRAVVAAARAVAAEPALRERVLAGLDADYNRTVAQTRTPQQMQECMQVQPSGQAADSQPSPIHPSSQRQAYIRPGFT